MRRRMCRGSDNDNDKKEKGSAIGRQRTARRRLACYTIVRKQICVDREQSQEIWVWSDRAPFSCRSGFSVFATFLSEAECCVWFESAGASNLLTTAMRDNKTTCLRVGR
mmetsp:Transcript_25642/g.56416  ORF Transcript_25642/g.56416 Transcript_25642/m.56416 type:complete len:109 (-) Transcript_25642:708-1034(-)